MTPWEIIEQALTHRKPPRSPKWLADQLGNTSIQVVQNWKTRGVPPARYRAIASALGISVDQLEGLAPLPWEKDFPWPFSSELQEQIELRNSDELLDLEIAMWEHMNVTLPPRLRQAELLRKQHARSATAALGVPGLAPQPDLGKSASK